MVVSYAAVFYMAGLFCVLCKPLFESWPQDEGDEIPADVYASLVYVVTLAFATGLFIFCQRYSPDSFKVMDDELGLEET